jgi:hypothetical protein
MKLTRFTKIAMGVLGAVLVGWLVLTLVTSGDTQKTKAVARDDKHCPECGRELPKNYRSGDECPYCKLESHSGGKSGKRNALLRANLTFPIIVGSLFAVLLAANIIVSIRARRRENKEEDYFVLQCPKCSRRIRYRESQFGKAALCPLCRRPIVFPRVRLSESRWLKMKRWLKLAPQ